MQELSVDEICVVSGGAPYCGPQGSILSNFVPDKVAGVDFGPACQKHDLFFESGSGVSMSQANTIFLEDMLAAASGNVVATVAAYVYYGFVSVFGGFFYEGGASGGGKIGDDWPAAVNPY